MHANLVKAARSAIPLHAVTSAGLRAFLARLPKLWARRGCR